MTCSIGAWCLMSEEWSTTTRLMTVSPETSHLLCACQHSDWSLSEQSPSFAEAMKSVRTMKIEELTEEQIMAARRRRSRERSAGHRLGCE